MLSLNGYRYGRKKEILFDVCCSRIWGLMYSGEKKSFCLACVYSRKDDAILFTSLRHKKCHFFSDRSIRATGAIFLQNLREIARFRRREDESEKRCSVRLPTCTGIHRRTRHLRSFLILCDALKRRICCFSEHFLCASVVHTGRKARLFYGGLC